MRHGPLIFRILVGALWFAGAVFLLDWAAARVGWYDGYADVGVPP